MKGRSDAAKQKREGDLVQAYNIASMSGAASVGKLKKFDHYLAQIKPRTAQGPAEMLATLRELKARGVPMEIKKVEGATGSAT